MKRSHIVWNVEQFNKLKFVGAGVKMFFNFNLNAPVLYKCVILFVKTKLRHKIVERYWTRNCCYGGEKNIPCYLFVSMFFNIYSNQWVKITKYKILRWTTQFWKCLHLLSVYLKQTRTRQGLEDVTRRKKSKNVFHEGNGTL